VKEDTTMNRRFPHILFLAAAAMLLLAPGAARADPPPPGPLDLTGEIDGAPFRIVVPASWNGKLLVLADGYRDKADHPGEIEDRTPYLASGPVAEATLLGEGWALAGTSYKSNGFAVKEALDDLVALASYFKDNVANPARTLLWSFSMGSVPTLELAERNGGTFDGYLAACSIGAGTPREADLFAVQRLAYDVTFGLPSAWGNVGDVRDDLDFEGEVLPVLFGHIFDPLNSQLNFAKFEFIRLVAGVPGSGLTPPTYPDWLFSDFYFASEGTAELERRAGGPVTQNLDHAYALTTAEKDYLAGIGIDADPLLQAMNARRNVSAPPASRNYVEHYAQYTGRIKKPVLTLHTVIDQLVPVANESAYRQTVEAAGMGSLLAQAYYAGRAGHCNFNAVQLVTALHALDAWVDSGVAPTDASFPTELGFVHGFVPPVWPYH
jgi:hypothetical protein